MNKDLRIPSAVEDFLSPFWKNGVLKDGLAAGVSEVHASALERSMISMEESARGSSVADMPLLRREPNMPIYLSRDTMSTGPDIIRFGSGSYFGDQPAESRYAEGDVFLYGDAEKLESFVYWALPRGVRSIGSVVVDSIRRPTTYLVQDVDFRSPGDGTIVFRVDPFLSQPDDMESITLWATEALVDYGDLFAQFSFMSGDVQSTEENRASIRSLIRLHSMGPSILSIDSFVASCANAPTAESDETIDRVETLEDLSVLVITDKSVYTILPTHTPRSVILPGYFLRSGEPLTLATQVFDLVENPRWWEQLVGISVGGNFLGGSGTAFLPNSQEVISVDSGGTARFPIYGEASAQTRFWAMIDAMSEDGPIYPTVPEPGESSIINPAEFAAKRLMGMSAIAILVDSGSVADSAAFFRRMKFLDSCTPAGAVVLLFFSKTIQDTSRLSIQTEEPTVALGIGGRVSSSVTMPGNETIKFSLSRSNLRRF